MLSKTNSLTSSLDFNWTLDIVMTCTKLVEHSYYLLFSVAVNQSTNYFKLQNTS